MRLSFSHSLSPLDLGLIATPVDLKRRGKELTAVSDWFLMVCEDVAFLQVVGGATCNSCHATKVRSPHPSVHFQCSMTAVDLTTPNTEGVKQRSRQNICKSERMKKGDVSSPPYHLAGVVGAHVYSVVEVTTSRCCCPGTARHSIGHIT